MGSRIKYVMLVVFLIVVRILFSRLTASVLDSEATDKNQVYMIYADDSTDVTAVEASIRSAMAHSSEPIAFHYFGHEPLSLPEVVFHNLRDTAEQYNLPRFANPHIPENRTRLNSNANYVRFVLHEIFSEVNKVVWIDSDTIVQCDVAPMFRNALTENNFALAAVPRKELFGIRNVEQYNITLSFNAGMIVMDLDRWREQDLGSEVLKWAALNREKEIYSLGSQPPLALAIRDSFEHLDQKWNFHQPGWKDAKFVDEEEMKNACVLHWAGKFKPWKEDGHFKEYWIPYAGENFKPMRLRS